MLVATRQGRRGRGRCPAQVVEEISCVVVAFVEFEGASRPGSRQAKVLVVAGPASRAGQGLCGLFVSAAEDLNPRQALAVPRLVWLDIQRLLNGLVGHVLGSRD